MTGSAQALDTAQRALRTVLDPELGLDIVALGLVYDVRADDGVVVVEMTLTTPGCPVAESLPCDAEAAVADALGPRSGYRVEVRLVWDPPWTPERIEEGADGVLRMGR